MRKNTFFWSICIYFCCFLGTASAGEAKTTKERREGLEKKRKVLAFKERYFDQEASRIQFLDWLLYRENVQKREWYRKQIEEVDRELEELK